MSILDPTSLRDDYEVSMKRMPKAVVAKRAQGHKSPGPNATIDLRREGFQQSDVHMNLGRQIIVVTEDRLRLELNMFYDSAKHRQGWHVPAGMLLTEVAAFVASSFHDTIGVSGQQWEALFRALMLVTVVWLLAALIRGGRSCSTDSLIENLKTGQPRGD